MTLLAGRDIASELSSWGFKVGKRPRRLKAAQPAVSYGKKPEGVPKSESCAPQSDAQASLAGLP